MEVILLLEHPVMSVDLCFEGKEGRKRGAAANSDIEKLSGVGRGEREREGVRCPDGLRRPRPPRKWSVTGGVVGSHGLS